MSWTIDSQRRVLTIACCGAVSDDDLLTAIPRIWEDHPEVIGFDTLVDVRTVTSEGGWSWSAMMEIAQLWRAFAGGRDHGRRTAIVTTDGWIAKLVGALAVQYRGRRFSCFVTLEKALTWVGEPQ